MAHTKAAGSSRLGRESASKRLGVKVADGQKIKAGMVLIRQRGTKWRAGKNVKMGSDDTLYAVLDGVVKFKNKKVRRFDNNRRIISEISVL